MSLILIALANQRYLKENEIKVLLLHEALELANNRVIAVTVPSGLLFGLVARGNDAFEVRGEDLDEFPGLLLVRLSGRAQWEGVSIGDLS
jgi:hypothetical protein